MTDEDSVRQEAIGKLREASQRIRATQRTSSLLDSYASMVPEALDSLTPDERHEVYRMLRLKVLAHPGKALDVSGVLEAHTTICGGEKKRCIVFPPTNVTAFTWVALLTEGGAERLELARA